MQTSAGTSNDSVSHLNSFLRGEISAVESYRKALRETKSDTVREELMQCHISHERRIELLKKRILELGGTPSTSSGAWGVFANAVESGAVALGESAAIAALEEGEDHGLADYRSDIDKLDGESRRLIESQVLPEQVRTHRILSTLKKQPTH